MSELLDESDPGRVEIRRSPDLPVDVLVAERSERRWVVLHNTYTVCTVQEIGRPVPWRYRGRSMDLGADGCSFMEPGEVHKNLEVSTPATFRVLFIEPQLVEQTAAEAGLSGAVHFKLAQIDQASHPRLRNALLALHASLDQAATPLERESRFARCLELIFEQCVERPPQSCNGSDPPGVSRARDFIEDHLTEPVRLEELVEAAGASSRFQLVRAFAAATGLPPHAYQLQRRISRSRELLARGVTPAQVAHDLGFVDQSHFTRHFTRVLGVPPEAYARAVRADAQERTRQPGTGRLTSPDVELRSVGGG